MVIGSQKETRKPTRCLFCANIVVPLAVLIAFIWWWKLFRWSHRWRRSIIREKKRKKKRKQDRFELERLFDIGRRRRKVSEWLTVVSVGLRKIGGDLCSGGKSWTNLSSSWQQNSTFLGTAYKQVGLSVSKQRCEKINLFSKWIWCKMHLSRLSFEAVMFKAIFFFLTKHSSWHKPVAPLCVLFLFLSMVLL